MVFFKHWIAVLPFILVQLLSCYRADFIVEVEFFSYQNPTHAALDFNGACCDQSTLHPPNCTNTCDNYFLICLTGNASTTPDVDMSILNDTCPFGWIITDQLARSRKDNVRFTTGSLDRSHQTPNPVVFESSNPWPGTIELVIIVLDEDSGGSDDLIDIISVPVINPSPLEVSINQLTGNLFNFYMGREGYSFVQLNFAVNCSQDFYGSDCATFCVPRNDTFGHFSCNETSGSIICDDGYTNTSIRCTQCVPAESCSSIGGFCNEPGDCICRDGFHGENCTEPLIIQTMMPNISDSTGVSLGPPIGGTITGIVILAAIGTVVTIAIIGELKRRKARSNFKKQQKRTRNSELLSNAAYIKTRVQVQDKHHEEFETSHNPGYRAVSLARRQANIISSYPGAHNPSHYVSSPTTSRDCQQEDLYYYSYPSTHPQPIQLNQGGPLKGVYSLEGPHSDDDESEEQHELGMDEQEDEYMYVSTEYVNGYSISPQGLKHLNNPLRHPELPVKKHKPMPLPRTKKTSLQET